MKLKISYTILLFGAFIICFSCKGQHTPENQNASLESENDTISIGHTVSEIQGKVMVVFQDKQNNYWFGGDDKGVYKYDGKNLVLITIEDGLCSHGVLGIQEDQFGDIYFDTPEGVCKFDGQKFTTLEIMDSHSSKNEWKLEAGDLWFRMGWNKKGPFRYDGQFLYPLEFPKTKQEAEFHAKYPNASYSPSGIYSMYQDHQGRLWFGTTSLGVCRYDGNSISWLYEKHLTETSNGGEFGIRSIIEDKDGYFWFCNTRYRYEVLPTSSVSNETSQIDYNRKDGVGKAKGNNEENFPYFMSIAEDDNGDLWMATYNDGVWRNNGKELIHYPVKDGDSDVLLYAIYKDKQAKLWLVTHEAGVYIFNGSKFEQFKV